METQQNDVRSLIAQLKKITPVSKYLSLALFVIMPFIGGYIGYSLPPEQVVAIEKIIEVEKNTPNLESTTKRNINSPLGIDAQVPVENVATRVVIETLRLNSGMQGSFPHIRKYSFQNAFYSISFDLSRYATFYDDYSDPTIDSLGKGTYLGIFTKKTYNEEVEPPTSTEETLFSIDVFSKDYCHMSLCEYETKSKVSFNYNEWEYIGPTSYCDVGPCGGSKYVYRRSLGGYMIYLKAQEDLTSKNLSADIRQVIDSLSINLFEE